MSPEQRAEVRRLAEQAHQLDSRSVVNRVSMHFLELRDTGERELTLAANAEGLLHVARVCLALAADGLPGSHHHFDELHLVDHCDRELVVVFKSADWDK